MDFSKRFGGEFDPTPLCRKTSLPAGFQGRSENLRGNEMDAWYGGPDRAANARAYIEMILIGETRNGVVATINDSSKNKSIIISVKGQKDCLLFKKSNLRYVIVTILGFAEPQILVADEDSDEIQEALSGEQSQIS